MSFMHTVYPDRTIRETHHAHLRPLSVVHSHSLLMPLAYPGWRMLHAVLASLLKEPLRGCISMQGPIL